MVEVFEFVKSNCDIVDVIGKYVELKRVGSSYRGFCPFHYEKEPSFFVSPEKRIFKCFGCGVGGDVIEFLSRVKGVSVWDAVEELLEMLSLRVNKIEMVNKKEKDKKRVDFPRGCVGLEDLKDMWVWEEVERFSVVHKVRVEDMMEWRWKWWNGRIIIPCWNKNREKLLYWTARAVSEVTQPRYVNCGVEEKVLWGLDVCDTSDKVLYLCEGWKDAYRVGGLAVLGKGISRCQIEMLKDVVEEDGVKELVVVFDSDAVKSACGVAECLVEEFGNEVRVGVGVLGNGLKDLGEAKDKEEALGSCRVFYIDTDIVDLIYFLRKC